MKRLSILAFVLATTLGQGCAKIQPASVSPPPKQTVAPQKTAPPTPPPNIPLPTPVQPKAY